VAKPTVSVVMTVRNASETIVVCLQSILSQTFENFEVVLIDDSSTDNTEEIIQKINDNRLRYHRNEKWLGITPSRNRGIKKASGEIVFFTDGDCRVAENWIEAGLKSLSDSSCLGVEGRIYYVSEDYKPTFSDRVMENRRGGNYMTGNIAYKKAAIEKVGAFDERLTYLEDRDIAFRVMKHGKICFNPDMIVYHPQIVVTPKKLLASASNIKNRVYMYKKHRIKDHMIWRILYPKQLVRLLFPPSVFFSLISNRFQNSNDFKLVPFTYIYLFLQRFHLWTESARERVFLI